MKLLGLDFDNTLVKYDSLFHRLALEKELITASVPVSKPKIRDFIQSKGLEDEFTLLQGEVYGPRILEAEPANHMLEALAQLQELDVCMVIVSHKTRFPYQGPKYELRKAAWNWLEQNNFFSSPGLNWDKSKVFFEDSKERKAARICSLGCEYYVDDLPEILTMLPDSITKFLYGTDQSNKKFHVFNDWAQFPSILNSYL